MRNSILLPVLLFKSYPSLKVLLKSIPPPLWAVFRPTQLEGYSTQFNSYKVCTSYLALHTRWWIPQILMCIIILSTPSEPDQVVTMVRKNIQHEKIIEPFAIFRKEQCDPNNKCLKIDQGIQEGAMREGRRGPLVQLTHWVSWCSGKGPMASGWQCWVSLPGLSSPNMWFANHKSQMLKIF